LTAYIAVNAGRAADFHARPALTGGPGALLDARR